MKKLLLASILASGFGLASAEVTDFITVADATGSSGKSVTVKVEMTNPNISACAYQCDIVLPAGATVVDNSLALSTIRCSDHVIASNILSDGSYRVLCYSLQNTAMTGTSGAVATFQIALEDSMEAGDYTLSVKNAELVDANSIAKIVADAIESGLTVSNGVYGDMTGDEKVNASDLSFVISALSSSSLTGDVNGDGKINASDISELITIILNQ